MRDDFSKEVLDTLARRVNLNCSNPGCRTGTTGPRTDPARSVCVGVGAHITAASGGGPRYDATLSRTARGAAENGIWLCQNCAKLVDNDARRYTPEVLRAWKHEAELAALAELEGTPTPAVTSAAELELSVGGVVLDGTRSVRTSNREIDRSGYCYRHDYVLTVTVRNVGNERLSGYHVDLEMPAAVLDLDRPETKSVLVAARTTRRVAFFRSAGTELYPGDECNAFALPYFVDHDIYHAREEGSRGSQAGDVFKLPVRVTLYQTGIPPISKEVLFNEMQIF